MKKWIPSIIMATIIIGMFLIMVFAPPTKSAAMNSAELAERSGETRLPKGSELLEIVSSNNGKYGYAIFRFRGECFIVREWHAMSMANIRCPDQLFGKVSTFTVTPDNVKKIVEAYNDD